MTPGSSRAFYCSWGHCRRSFNRKSDLGRHYRIHTNDRPYQCTVEGCNKTFIQKSALTVHSRTHTGEKPHVCGQQGCQKAFADSSSLARHRRIHTGVRPYICQERTCERSFCRKITLVRHQNRLHPQVKVAPASSEDDKVRQLHQVFDNTSPSYDQCLLPQDPYYEQAATPNLEFKIQQNLQLTYNVAQGILLPIEFWNFPAMAPFYMQHTPQLYLQPMHQQYSQSYPNHTPSDFNQPSSASYAMAERY